MYKKIFLFTFIFLTSVSITIPIEAREKSDTYVNIISWWGYLNHSWVSPYIESRCDAKISVDQYYSNNQFIDIFKRDSKSYDIAIFQSPSYDEISYLIPSIDSSSVHLKSSTYHPVIKEHYNKRYLPHNSAYFFQSVTGVLWNDNVISSQNNKSIPMMLSDVSGKLVTSLDSPIYLSSLISINNIGDKTLSYENYKKLFGDNTVIFANSFYKNVYDSKKFALSYTWSGEAMNDIEKSLNENKHHLHFTVNPNYSVVSSDVVVAMNSKNKTECVTNVLASKKFMEKLQLDTYYFTPYVDYSNVKNKLFLSYYTSYKKQLKNLKWLPILTKEQNDYISEDWSYIAMKAREKLNRQENNSSD